jgi:hypothetical protein
MFVTFNEQFKDNPAIFAQRDKPSDPFYGRIEGYYWSSFEPLEPRAKEVVRQIRDYLSVCPRTY